MTVQIATKAQIHELMPAVLANLAKKLVPEDGPELAEGKYHLQAKALVVVDAYVTKQADGEYTPVEVPLKAVLAVALAELLPADQVEAFIGGCALKAMKADKSITKAVDEALDKFKSAIASTLPKRPRKGALKVEGEVKIRELEKIVAAA